MSCFGFIFRNRKIHPCPPAPRNSIDVVSCSDSIKKTDLEVLTDQINYAKQYNRFRQNKILKRQRRLTVVEWNEVYDKLNYH